MRKHILGSLTTLLVPFAAYGAPTGYGAYRRSQPAVVSGYRPLSPATGRKTPPAKLQSSVTEAGLVIATGSPARELVIIDAAVPDKTLLQSAARPGVETVVLEAGKDSLAQTAALLKNYRDLEAVHLVSHGEAGAILLGGRRIDKTALEADPRFLQALGQATRAGADLLLYGCDVASEDAGLLEIIRGNSHLDVAASSNRTGAAELGGDWTLEIAAGNIETERAFSDKALQDFSSVLRPFGTQIFEGLNTEYYQDDPSIDWDDFTTYIPTPGTNLEILSSGINNSCDDGPGDGLYVSMFYAGSRFYIRSNPAGEYFGVTGLNIRTGSPQYGANAVTITGYDTGGTAVGTKGPVTLGPDSPTGTPIDLTTGITGSFADIVRFRIAATSDVAPGDERDFCLVSVDFTPLDSDGNLTPAGGVTEPVGLDTTVDSFAERVDIFDFTLSDGGGSDGQPLTVSNLVVNVSGTSTDTERGQIIWYLDGPDITSALGTFDAGTDTITFTLSGLVITVADGASETYTISAFYDDNTNLTAGHTIQLGIDGDTDLTVDPEGTQMGATAPVTNGTGTTIDAVATQLVFSTQPAGSVSGAALSTQPVVEARDAFGNIAGGFTETIILTEASAGTLSNNSLAAAAGVATFTNLAYTTSVDGESFTITADDQGGVGSDLTAVDANPVISDVVATGLLFTTQPAPTTVTSGDPTAFTTVPVVSAVDANGAVDTDYSTDITLAEVNGAGSATMTATGDADFDGATVTIAPSNGSATFTGLNITYTSSGGNETFNLRASSGPFAPTDSVVLTAVDGQAPEVSSVSVPANGTYGPGDNLDFTVDTSENVTVTGMPRIPLILDSSTVYANYIGGSGTSALAFRYTVQVDDSDTDGIGVGAAIEPNGGTLEDGDGNSLITGLNNVDATTGVLVDAVAPAAPSTPDLAATSDSGSSNTDNITADVTPTLTGTAEADTTVTVISDIEGTLGTTAADGSGNWSFTPGAALSENTHSLTATATDAMNNESAASNALSVTLDSQAPSVDSLTLPADATYTAGENLDFVVNYDEAATVDTAGGTPRLELTIGAATRYAIYISGSGSSTLLFRHTVQSGDSDGDGIALSSTLDSNGGSIHDTAGNVADPNLGAIGSLAGVLVTDQFSIGGTVSGLEGSGLMLQNNGGDDLAIAADGAFTFATELDDLSSYNVAVSTQPTDPSQTCSVSNGSGALAGANVVDVAITCSTDTFTIGGTVTGLEGDGLMLQNDGGDDLAITADGAFTFATELQDLSSYSVAVSTQPTDPTQTCSVANGVGTLAGADVIDVAITCSADTFTIGGTVSGLEGSDLVLQNNGGDDLAITADGAFTFATAVADGSAYAVTVLSQPTDPAQTCSVANGSGALAGADVTDAVVSCESEPAAIGLSTDLLDFGIVAPGETASATVAVTNTGTGELVIDGIVMAVVDPGPFFGINAGTCASLPVTLLPGESCDIQVEIRAGDFAGRHGTHFVIESNAASSPYTVILSVTIADRPAAIPVLGPFGLALMALSLALAGLTFARRRRSTTG